MIDLLVIAILVISFLLMNLFIKWIDKIINEK
jgi:hypothetical protein